jgi:hypothetical protein
MYFVNKLPSYFYDITHPTRWTDPYSTALGEDRLVLTPREISEKAERDRQYLAWLGKFRLKGKNPKFQAIRVIRFKHSTSVSKDWWERYQDCAFRVYVQPENTYDGKAYKQWYVLSPEDAYLVNRYELERDGPTLPPRDWTNEKYISTDKRLRRARIIPCECCAHMRHETTGGQLPDGL